MKKTYLGISIETDKDKLLSTQAAKLLKDYYCIEGEDSPQMAYALAAKAYCYGDIKFAQRIYNYVSNKWFMFASPVLSNAPKQNGKVKALPISCFLSYVPDTLEGLIETTQFYQYLL